MLDNTTGRIWAHAAGGLTGRKVGPILKHSHLRLKHSHLDSFKIKPINSFLIVFFNNIRLISNVSLSSKTNFCSACDEFKVVKNVKRNIFDFSRNRNNWCNDSSKGPRGSLGIHSSGRVYALSIFPALYLHFGEFAKSCFLKFCHELQNDGIQNAESLRVRVISAWRHRKVPKAESGLPSANNNLFSQPFADNNRLLHGFTGNVLCRFKTNENSY